MRLHLPHAGHGLEAFAGVLEEVRSFLAVGQNGHKVIIGMDANVSMLTDHVHVGEAVMRKAHTVTNAERAASLQLF